MTQNFGQLPAANQVPRDFGLSRSCYLPCPSHPLSRLPVGLRTGMCCELPLPHLLVCFLPFGVDLSSVFRPGDRPVLQGIFGHTLNP